MIALEVFLNDEKVAVAGAEDLAVLSASVTAVGKLGAKARGTTSVRRGQHLSLEVGGLTGRLRGARDEHLRWGPERVNDLSVGDEVRVRIVRAKRADRPTTRVAGGSRKDLERERFEWAKKVYLAGREKYEKRAR